MFSLFTVTRLKILQSDCLTPTLPFILVARLWSRYGLLTMFGLSVGSKGLCSMLFRGIDTLEARVVWPFAVDTYVGMGAMAFLAKPSSVESPGILRNCLV